MAGCEEIVLNVHNPDVVSNYGYFPLLFSDEETRNKVYDRLKSRGIHTRKYFYPLTSDQVCFNDQYKDTKLDRAREYSKRILVLPIYPDLEEEVVVRVAEEIICLVSN